MTCYLYLLTRSDPDDVDYDEYNGFVIAAETENRARLMAQDKEHTKDWIGDGCKVEILSADLWDNQPRIVLSDFRAG